jgi:hypothetical protein
MTNVRHFLLAIGGLGGGATRRSKLLVKFIELYFKGKNNIFAGHVPALC